MCFGDLLPWISGRLGILGNLGICVTGTLLSGDASDSSVFLLQLATWKGIRIGGVAQQGYPGAAYG